MERQDAIDLGASWDDMKAKAGRRVGSTIRCMNSWKNVETIEGMIHFNSWTLSFYNNSIFYSIALRVLS